MTPPGGVTPAADVHRIRAKGRSMLTVRTLAPGKSESTRRVWTSHTGVSTELTTFSTTTDPARSARRTVSIDVPVKWSRAKSGAASPGSSIRPRTVSD